MMMMMKRLQLSLLELMKMQLRMIRRKLKRKHLRRKRSRRRMREEISMPGVLKMRRQEPFRCLAMMISERDNPESLSN